MTHLWKALIVDDEAPARRELARLLRPFPEVTVVGEAANIDSAEKLILRTSPDLVFLDVQMPRGSGFDLLEKVEMTFKAIFVTAHDRFAIRAFEVNALDYLVKPVTAARLEEALGRLRGGVLQVRARTLDYDDQLFLTVKGRARFAELGTISCILADRSYTHVHLVSKEVAFVVRSLRQWEAILPPKKFVRIHRSTIINFDHVERMDPWTNYTYRVMVRGFAEPLEMSRRRARLFKSHQ